MNTRRSLHQFILKSLPAFEKDLAGRMSRLLCIGFLLICMNVGARAQRAPAPKSDTQSWNDIQLTIPLNKQFDFILTGTLRIGRNITHPVDERIGISFSYKPNKYFSIAPGYTHIRMQPTATQHNAEERLSVAATITLPGKRFTLSDRNTFERRFRRPQIDATRYRNRLQLEYPFKVR